MGVTVSVILPTYNRKHLISRAIESVLNQTYKDFELIIIDDGSTDDTQGTIKSFSDKRIVLIKHGTNKGANSARNSGLAKARGEYIAFIDSDDEWFPEKLRKQVELLGRLPTNVGVVYTSMWEIPLSGPHRLYESQISIMPENGLVYNDVLRLKLELRIGTSAVIRKECFEKSGGFDERLRASQDLELFLRISKDYLFYHIKEPLLNYYETENSVSSSKYACFQAKMLIYKKHSSEMKKLADKRTLAKYLYKLGHFFYRHGYRKEGLECLIESLKIYPFNVKYLTALLLTILGPRLFKKLQKK